jgi:radical SAM enzyme (TIGR01210 family)
MCDLWRHTLEESVPAGAIPAQIRAALARLPSAPRIKLYNAGSFFDPKAIPSSDHEAIAALLEGFERITVECHPALVGEPCFRFHEILGGRLEVAMGLETVHPVVLPRLNKGMTSEQFRRAADLLGQRGIALRSFVLVGLPFVSSEDSVEWCDRSVEFAFDSGSSVVSLIPTRSGNGALDTLALAGDFLPPTLGMLEETVARGIARRRGRVFADLWDLARLKHCDDCFDARASRLQKINLEQRIPPPVRCSSCGGGR